MMRCFLFGMTLLAAVVPAACGGAAPAFSCQGISNLPAIPVMQLVYPAPGATNVPDQPGSIVVAFSSQMGAWEMLLQSTGAPVDIGPLGPPPSPMPSPAATPFFANPVYYGVAAPHLDAATAYTVDLKETTLPCIPVSSLGSFTTR